MLKLFFSAITAVSLFATASLSQSLGVDFKKMPIGTKIYYQASNGETWVSTFKGKKGKNYLMSVDVSRKGRSYRGTQRYTLAGHKSRWNNGGGYTENWRPFSCNQVVGSCTHKWNASNGKGTSWIYETTRNGNTLTQKSRPKRAVDMQVSTSKIGKYNLVSHLKWTTNRGQKRWQKITKIVEPN